MKNVSTQDYVKAIFQIQEKSQAEFVSTMDLADRLGIKAGSVTNMLKKLSTQEPFLIDYIPYEGARLTQAGEKMALEVIRHHRLIETYLNQALGYRWDEVHEEAEQLEHVISETLEERMAAALGNPRVDPHGEPIPDRNGQMDHPAWVRLTQLEPGQHAVIQRVSARDPELLRYLESLNLTIHTEVEIMGKEPFNGPLSIRSQEESGRVHPLGREVTDNIFVLVLN